MSENQSLKENVEILSKQSLAYEKKVSNLNNVILKSTLFKIFANGVRLLTMKNNLKQQDGSISVGMNNSKATGVVLLILIFSFGFFIKPDNIIDDSKLNSQLLLNNFGSNFGIEEENFFKTTKFENMVTLSQEDSSVDELGDKKKGATKIKSKNLNNNEDKKGLVLKQQQTLLQINEQTSDKIEQHKSIRVKVEMENPIKNETLFSSTNDEIYYHQEEVLQVPLILPEIKEWKPNTTYLLCNNVKHLTPPIPIPNDTSTEMMLSLFIPPDHHNPAAVETCPEENSMLEVTCKVVDLKVSRILQ